MKVLVTGVAGFVGLHLAEKIISSGHQVVGIDVSDRHGRLQASNILQCDSFRFIRTNLAVDTVKSDYMDGINAIVHLAALPHVDYSYYHPRQVFDNNIRSVQTILDIATSEDIPLLFSSSVECYGGRVDKLYSEVDNPEPLSPYAASKVAAEALITSYIETQGLKATILRFTNLYGPWQAPDRLIPRVIGQVLGGIPVTVEQGTHRDFMYVLDACRIIEMSLGLNFDGQMYNLSSGVKTDNLDAVQLVVQQSSTPVELTIRPPKSNDGRGQYLIADPTKLQSALGTQPGTNLEEGIRSTVDWYSSHTGWLRQFAQNIQADRASEDFLTDLNWNAAGC